MDRMFPTDAMYVAARREAANLYAEWERACQMVRDSYTDYAQSKADEFEQDAYDRLVDYVETNELNYSEYDPRNDTDDYAADEAEARSQS